MLYYNSLFYYIIKIIVKMNNPNFKLNIRFGHHLTFNLKYRYYKNINIYNN